MTRPAKRHQQFRPKCVFCGEPGSSREHVFGSWLGGVFGEAGPFTLEYSDGRKPKTSLLGPPIVSRAPCKRCNETWMSSLENRARPLLGPVIKGDPAEWSSADQTLIGAWAFKTALMLDRTRRDRHVVWPEHFTYLRETTLPPPSAQIHLAHYFPTGTELEKAPAISARVGIDQVLGFNETGVYRISFNVGQIIFDVRGFPGLEPVALRPVRFGGLESGLLIPLTASFVELWPHDGSTVSWPPPGPALSTQSLRAFLG